MRQTKLLLIITFIISYCGSAVGASAAAIAADQNSSDHNHQPVNRDSSNRCILKSTCKVAQQKQKRKSNFLDGTLQGNNNSNNNKRSCYCDFQCKQYDDCCGDSSFAQSARERRQLGARKLEEKRNQWHCHRVNPIFGDILIKASCSPDWNSAQSPLKDPQLKALIERRCGYVKDRGKGSALNASKLALEYQSDPVGMMLPITDLTTNITYANSYCLRCNRLTGAPKLIYWSPLIECNYNKNTDDRNTLFDLIRANEGQVLQFSEQRNSWAINATQEKLPGVSANSSFERLCSISPTVPEQIEHLVRYCVSNTISRCPESYDTAQDKLLLQTKRDCQLGHQALVYGETSDLVYFNEACARCNGESSFSCEKRIRKPFYVSRIFSSSATSDHTPNFSPFQPFDGTDSSSEDNTTDHDQANDNNEHQANPTIIARGGHHGFGSPIAGSFSLLMDLSGVDMGNDEVGSVHQCKDTVRQVYDPFHLACRDIICGFEGHFIDGACVSPETRQDLSFKSNLVAKFNPTMSLLTAICLPISIASLSLYLLLYLLSMFDLRHMLVDMAQAEQRVNRPNSPLQKPRDSRTSNQSVNNPRAQSLSSRGLACLASSLLAAYLLFMLGQRPADEEKTMNSIISGEDNNNNNSSSSSSNSISRSLNETALTGPSCTTKRSSSCLVLAVATYYCFLVSFNWMFLLSYDIWRTLRLATCQLRAPALHGQSSRFIVYALFSLLSAAIVVGLALAIDLSPAWLECASSGSSCAESEFGRLILAYRPRFGYLLGSCWFSNKRALALFFGLPISLIMLLNLLFFLHSSFMVIRTSSDSARRLGPASPATQMKLAGGITSSQLDATHMDTSYESACTQITTIGSTDKQQSADFTHLNNMTASSLSSMQTFRSSLSSSDSAGEDSSGGEESQSPATHLKSTTTHTTTHPPPDGAPSATSQTSKRPLVSSKSSSSLGNQSVGGVSIATSLALKYDAHMHSLSAFMASIAKDYRLYCRLSIIMGLTWLTGLVASVVDESELLWYLFVVLNTLQGLFIFIAFGCKRSKLCNLQILADYTFFKLSQKHK